MQIIDERQENSKLQDECEPEAIPFPVANQKLCCRPVVSTVSLKLDV